MQRAPLASVVRHEVVIQPRLAVRHVEERHGRCRCAHASLVLGDALDARLAKHHGVSIAHHGVEEVHCTAAAAHVQCVGKVQPKRELQPRGGATFGRANAVHDELCDSTARRAGGLQLHQQRGSEVGAHDALAQRAHVRPDGLCDLFVGARDKPASTSFSARTTACSDGGASGSASDVPPRQSATCVRLALAGAVVRSPAF
mmetsp:Transcript_9980/g.41350  ORF Transcript_9980/g.41350 Transcript_9980/m.41350 type:complete len:201 (-) Transcript_9980:79-681(-)